MKMVIKSNIIKKEKIVSKTEWFNYIDELKKESKSLIKLNEKKQLKF
jgi:hypothetical protein